MGEVVFVWIDEFLSLVKYVGFSIRHSEMLRIQINADAYKCNKNKHDYL